MLRHRLPAACIVLLILLSGCAGPASRDQAPASWAQHRDSLQRLQHWQARGKLALRTSDRSESASFLWQQRQQHIDLQLSGPIGLSATSIHSDGLTMEIRQGDELRSWDISSPQAIAANTGWDLPLQALPYWLRGIPSPLYDIQLLEVAPGAGTLQTLRQDDWEIHYESYGRFEQLTLPTRLKIQRGDTSARMIIRDWQTTAS
jgi:outer membrane lipoprotein LolB